MIGRRFHAKIGWISNNTSSIECKPGSFNIAAFGEKHGPCYKESGVLPVHERCSV